MFPIRIVVPVLILAASLVAPAAIAQQQRPDPASLIAAQRDAMKPLAFMDGIWRGTSWIIRPTGEKHEGTQTERIGPFLDGSVKVIEGRGYDADGSVSFNALGVVSFDPGKRAYTLHSYAMGSAGDFAFTPSADGYVWEIPAGPMTIRYTATVKDGAWHEVGDRVTGGDARFTVRFFEMTLKRVGDTDWPAAGAIPPK
ncbi:MAG TPA: DUF1579 domain-containing protein [Candidatus Eisenbacteria bacterium]